MPGSLEWQNLITDMIIQNSYDVKDKVVAMDSESPAQDRLV